MTHEQKIPPVMRVRNVVLAEKNNRGLHLTMVNGTWSVVPVVGDAFQVLKTDDSGEYAEFYVSHRIFREVPESERPPGVSDPVAMFDAVAVVIQRPVQWQP